MPALATSRAQDLTVLWLSAVTLLVRSLTDHDTAGAELAPARRVLATRFIDAHLGDPGLCPSMVATALGVSRRTLYRSFGDGPGVAAVIRERRLRWAGALIRDPRQHHRPISEIAAEVGLPNAAHFSRMYRTHFGEPPRAGRGCGTTTRLVGDVGSPVTPISEPPVGHVRNAVTPSSSCSVGVSCNG